TVGSDELRKVEGDVRAKVAVEMVTRVGGRR
ncbi:hypothetical protein A2U01_0046294, partial [Trifolium medium]|nr:hypothetical protein [Trifolium medium]